MPKLVKDGAIITDDWQVVEALELDQVLPEGQVILPLSYWLEHQTQLADNNNVGVWIDGDTDLGSIGSTITQASIIAVRFPAFMDGRGFSAGRLLRERYQFTGELRAIGQFIRDQLCYLRRCGFNAFQFGEDENVAEAVQSLADFQEYYQASVDEPLPLFRRRRA